MIIEFVLIVVIELILIGVISDELELIKVLLLIMVFDLFMLL